MIRAGLLSKIVEGTQISYNDRNVRDVLANCATGKGSGAIVPRTSAMHKTRKGPA